MWIWYMVYDILWCEMNWYNVHVLYCNILLTFEVNSDRIFIDKRGMEMNILKATIHWDLSY